jgi:hypothetical protein
VTRRARGRLALLGWVGVVAAVVVLGYLLLAAMEMNTP